MLCDVDDTFLPAGPVYNKSWNTCIVYIYIYMGSSGRSVSTVSAGGWSNAGRKTNRGFRVNINYYLRAGMNGGGVSVGRR